MEQNQTMPLSSLLDSGQTLAVIKGSRHPRISTPPLVKLTPETSYGFGVIELARDVLKEPLLPWQEDLVIRIGELLPNGKPRFKKILILVARQNGKTHLVKVLSLYWLFVQQVDLIAGISSKLEMAKEAWNKSIQSAQNSDVLRPLIAQVKNDNNDPVLRTISGSRYKPAAANEGSLRGFTVSRLIVDELRLHKDYKAWNAAAYTVRAVPDSQIICITNAGSSDSVVLNELRDSAIQYINSDGLIGDQSLGLFEWSAKDGADPMDANSWIAANPSMGLLNPITNELVLDPKDIQADAIRDTNTGGLALTGFMTETLCMHVPVLDTAFDWNAWKASTITNTAYPNMASRTVWGFDVSPKDDHATLIAAVKMDDGKNYVQVIKEWRGQDLSNVVDDVYWMLDTYRPRVFSWMPIGPAATYGPALKNKSVPGVVMEPLTGEVTDAVMGLANAIATDQIRHNGDEMLTAHITNAEKLHQGDRWKLTRKGKGNVDAAYAMAVAWHALVTLPPTKQIRLVGPDDNEGEDE